MYLSPLPPQLNEELETLTEELARLIAESAHSDQLEALQKTVADMATRLSADKLPPSSPTRRRRHVSDVSAQDRVVQYCIISAPLQRDRDQDNHSRHRRKHRDRHTSSQATEPPATPSSPSTTRVLYYMSGEKADTPFVAIVPKK